MSTSIIKSSVLTALAAIAIKVLMFPCYRSSDFEVHRNWLAITHSVPLQQWYYESTSEWTLDYPPFFAYFEYILSLVANIIDNKMVQVSNLHYASMETILFQRTSVIATELVLYYATYRFLQSSKMSIGRSRIIFALVVFNAGIILVDNVHFQYNGMLLGILILCLDCANRNKHLTLTALFSVLVLMKHLFAPLALVFGAYLLNTFCLPLLTSSKKSSVPTIDVVLRFVWRFLNLAFIAVIALAVAFLPFVLAQDSTLGLCIPLLPSLFSSTYICASPLIQIFTRLFPFGRGLIHAYWAPNVWALYMALDKALYALNRRIGFAHITDMEGNSSTSGLVGDFAFHFLPKITPAVSLLLVVVFISPALVLLLLRKSQGGTSKKPPSTLLLRAVVFASFTSFMLGYHVHEKAILVPLLPATLLVSADPPILGYDVRNQARRNALYMQCAAGGLVGLLPLFHGVQELVLKGLLCFGFLLVVHLILSPVAKSGYSRLNLVTITVLLAVYFYAEVIHPLVFRSSSGDIHLPFLPLILYSTTCAIVLLSAWVLSAIVLFESECTEYELVDEQESQNNSQTRKSK